MQPQSQLVIELSPISLASFRLISKWVFSILLLFQLTVVLWPSMLTDWFVKESESEQLPYSRKSLIDRPSNLFFLTQSCYLTFPSDHGRISMILIIIQNSYKVIIIKHCSKLMLQEASDASHLIKVPFRTGSTRSIPSVFQILSWKSEPNSSIHSRRNSTWCLTLTTTWAIFKSPTKVKYTLLEVIFPRILVLIFFLTLKVASLLHQSQFKKNIWDSWTCILLRQVRHTVIQLSTSLNLNSELITGGMLMSIINVTHPSLRSTIYNILLPYQQRMLCNSLSALLKLNGFALNSQFKIRKNLKLFELFFGSSKITLILFSMTSAKIELMSSSVL